MSGRKRLNIILPEWFQVELQTQKTITRLSGVHELLFYLNNPDEYIRHQAVMRLGQLGGKEIITPLNKIIEDSLEITLNRELAAWVLKSTGLIGNDDYFIGNNYLDRFTGNEKLKDFYYPSFTEGSSAPEYHFAASGIGALLLEETLMIRAESQETNVEIPFSFAQWLKVWSKTKRDNLRKGLEAMREKSAAATAGFTQKIMHPDKTAYKKKQKRFQITKQKPAAEKNPLQIKWPELSEESQTLHEASPELLSGEYETLLETRFEFLSKEAKTIYEATPELLSEEYEPLLETTAEFLSEEDQTLYESVSEISVEENHPDHSENIAIHITESVSRQEERTENHNMGISVAQTQNIESRKTGIQGVQIKNAAGSEASDQVSVNIIRNEPVNSISVTAATAEKMKPEVRNLLYPEKNAPVEVQDKESRQADVELKPDHYIKPFKLKSCPEEKEKKTNRTKSKIYVRKNAHELSFADVLKGLVLKIGKIILLPFVVFWNQKLVFLLLIVCLYLFFTLVPLGRMLFYRRSPDLAQLNDRVLKTAQIWVADQITQLEAMASEYELVRDIQKKMVTETQEQEQQAPEPVKYIVTSKTLNVRKEPGTQADKLLRLEQNMIVEFLNQSTDIDGKTWVYIQTPDGTAGWSNASYLKKVEGELEAYEGE